VVGQVSKAEVESKVFPVLLYYPELSLTHVHNLITAVVYSFLIKYEYEYVQQRRVGPGFRGKGYRQIFFAVPNLRNWGTASVL